MSGFFKGFRNEPQSSSFEQHHAQVHNTNARKLDQISADVVAGAATHGAMEAFEKHCKDNGKPTSHQNAKNMLTELTAAEVDKIANQKGLSSDAKARAHKMAQGHVGQALDKSGHY